MSDALQLARQVIEWADGKGNRSASQWVHGDTVTLARALLTVCEKSQFDTKNANKCPMCGGSLDNFFRKGK